MVSEPQGPEEWGLIEMFYVGTEGSWIASAN